MARLQIPERLLLGPGPSPVVDRVRQAMALPLLGHMDGAFLSIVAEVQEQLRVVFGTTNRVTFPVSGTGSAGMEMSLVSMVEPGDTVVVVEQGVFGQRLAEAARRLGVHVVSIAVPFGEICPLERLVETLDANPAVSLIAVVKAETSTGVLQPLEGWSEEAHRRGALLLVDAVTALGGLPVEVDRMGFDIVFSGSQKCLAAPPGLAPFTMGERALHRLQNRRTPPPSWYFDVTAIIQYLGETRAYHHTAPISMIYGLREALAMLLEEGLVETWQRHQLVAESVWSGLEAMGLELMVDRQHRLYPVAVVRIPAGIDDARVRQRLLTEYHIEIAGALGPWAGKAWRIGIMGQGARIAPMMTLLQALHHVLELEGLKIPSGLAAMEETYAKGVDAATHG